MRSELVVVLNDRLCLREDIFYSRPHAGEMPDRQSLFLDRASGVINGFPVLEARAF